MENNDENKQLYDMLWKQTTRFFVSAVEQLLSSMWKIFSEGLEEIRETIKKAETEFEQTSDILQEMEKRSKDIGLIIREQSHSIQPIAASVDSGNKTMRDHSERVDRLDEKVEIIQKNSKDINLRIQNIADISETLMVLSINGSIQAARSGEAGQGFAVVTDEMRKISLGIKDFSEHQKESISMIIRLMSEILEVNRIGRKSLNDGKENLEAAHESLGAVKEKLNEAELFAENLSGEIRNLYPVVERCAQSLGMVASKIGTVSDAMERRMKFNQSLTQVVKKLMLISRNSSSLQETAMAQMESIESMFNSMEHGLPHVVTALATVILPYSDLPESFKKEMVSRAERRYRESDPFLCLMGMPRTHSEWKDLALFKESIRVPLIDGEMNTSKTHMLQNILSIAGEGIDTADFFRNESVFVLQGTNCSLVNADNAERYVPNSNFIETNKILSQLGVGGTLPSEALFAVIFLFDQKLTEEDSSALSVLGSAIQLTWSEFAAQKNFWEE